MKKYLVLLCLLLLPVAVIAEENTTCICNYNVTFDFTSQANETIICLSELNRTNEELLRCVATKEVLFEENEDLELDIEAFNTCKTELSNLKTSTTECQVNLKGANVDKGECEQDLDEAEKEAGQNFMYGGVGLFIGWFVIPEIQKRKGPSGLPARPIPPSPPPAGPQLVTEEK